MLTNKKNGLLRLLSYLGLFGSYVDGDNAGGDNAGGDNAGGDNNVTITQDKLNSLIDEKFKKGATKATETLLSELGFKDVDSLKDELGKLKESNSTLEGQLNNLITENEVYKVATANNVKDVELFTMLYKQESIKDNFNADGFLKDLKEKRSFLFDDSKQTNNKTNVNNPPNGNNNPNGGTIKRSDFERLTPADRMQKLKDGVKVID